MDDLQGCLKKQNKDWGKVPYCIYIMEAEKAQS